MKNEMKMHWGRGLNDQGTILNNEMKMQECKERNEK